MSIVNENEILRDLISAIAAAKGIDVEYLREQLAAKRAQYMRRVRARNQRYHAALATISEAQIDKLAALEAKGYEINKLYQNRASQRVALMLVKDPSWDSIKGRMGRILCMLYPDGSQVETYEKKISIKQSF